MTPFVKASFTRALCAAVWCVPGALWWTSPAWAGVAPTNELWVFDLPKGGFRCGTRSSVGVELARSWSMNVAIASGEYADSLASITRNPQIDAASRERASTLLRGLGDPRALRHPAAQPLQLPPLVVRPAP